MNEEVFDCVFNLLSETRAEAWQQLEKAQRKVQKLTMLNKSLESMWAARAEEAHADEEA